TLLIVARFADSGVRTMIRLPTAMTGAAAGRTKTATNSPTPTATAALRTPMSQPTGIRVRTGQSSQSGAHRIITELRRRQPEPPPSPSCEPLLDAEPSPSPGPPPEPEP